MPDTARGMRKPEKTRRINGMLSSSRMGAILLLTALIDQAGKLAVSRVLQPGMSAPVIKDVFHITLVHNTGAVFGFFRGMNVFLVISSALFLFLLVYYYPRLEEAYPGFNIPAGLIAGGAAGNMADRLRLGYVIDFLDFRIWPVFNIADIAITAGVGIVILRAWRKR